MTSSAPKPRTLTFKRVRGYLAALAVVGIAGTAIIAPLASPKPALADEAFYERIHQEFVPQNVDPIDIDLAAAPAEELPPEPAPAPAATASGGSGSLDSHVYRRRLACRVDGCRWHSRERLGLRRFNRAA